MLVGAELAAAVLADARCGGGPATADRAQIDRLGAAVALGHVELEDPALA
ncbi:Uncharacterised protein [Mycobacteroides abscessus subsp. abscessus]|nr:Uncharacterised protein [Mycobacteroides abscessus subsp. abscessus]